MTDMTIAALQLAADQQIHSIPKPDAAQQFEALLDKPAHTDVYSSRAAAPTPQTDSLRPVQLPPEVAKAGNDLSSQLREMTDRFPKWEKAIDTETYPELAVQLHMQMEMRKFMMLDTQIHFVSKAVEISDKGLQTLYKQQG
jgi:hypothetical protein